MATKRKKILAINFFPAMTPPRSGGELRYFHIYRFLRKHYDIDMVNPTHLFVEPETACHFPNMTGHRVPKNKIHLFFHRLFNVIGRFPECSAVVVMLASYLDRSLKTKVDEFLPGADIVIHESPFLFNLAPNREGQILIYNSYNVEYDLQKDMLKGPVGWLLSRWVRRLEKRACRRADIVFATSAEDRLRFSNLYGISLRKILLVPNGVDPDEILPAAPEEKAKAREKLGLGEESALLFFGSAHPPNIRAVKYILETLAPALPQASFILAGGVSRHFEGRETPNARLLGRVSDEDKILLLKAVDVALNPMFSGSGTNLKMFDYLSAGLPVVSTPIGARGIPFVNYQEMIVVEPEGFTGALRQLLEDPGLRRRLSFHGRNKVETGFHWKNLAGRVHRAISELEKPHVTVINDFTVLPPRHGGQYRILSLYRELSRFIPVYYLCLHKESGDIEETRLGERFIQTAIPKGFWRRLIESLLGRLLHYTVDDVLGIFFAHRNPLMKREIRQAARYNDILVSVHPYQWKLISPFRNKIRIYESLNYESLLKKQTLAGIMGRLFVWFTGRVERRAVRESTAVFTVSDEEGRAFCRDFGIGDKWTTIPNGTDTTRITPPSKEERKELREYLEIPGIPVALFVGSAHPPNVEAGRLLIERIAPAVPDVLFFLVGSVCWVVKNIPDRPGNVKLFFEVDEKVRNELFKTADFAVNPMTSGAGTSLKMFDYLAAGLPVISTPLGARGVAGKEEDTLLLCEIDEFPGAVRRLAGNPEKRSLLARKGREYVQRRFDWQIIAKRCHDRLLELWNENTAGER